MLVSDLPTPALVADLEALDQNIATMSEALPGTRLRPHVKAHKCTTIARRQSAAGHLGFTCATTREVVGLADAGLGHDVLLANETIDPRRLRAMADATARVTVAVDSEATIAAASANGIVEVLVDVNVGLPRCGCRPDDAGRLADAATRAGLSVRGVMGYEGHVVGLESRAERRLECEQAMTLLARAHELVGGEVISAGGTGTYDLNRVATEIQAGSYVLSDTAYSAVVPEFRPGLFLVGTIVSADHDHMVADVGLKAMGMDHGNPSVSGSDVWFCSDEHLTLSRKASAKVGDHVVVWPAHIDPTVAYHERLFVASGSGLDTEVVDEWPIDLRGW